jgi:hypothetical protein
VDRLISKLKTIVNHFKRSSTATEKLIKYQIQVGVAQPKKLLIDVPLEPISADDWKLCEDLCTVFKPLEEVTRQISGERYLTGSLVIVFNRTLTIYENKIPNDPALHQSAIAAAKKIKNELCARLQNIEYSGTFSICTFLDPRFKTHLFKDKSAADVAKKKVSELVASEISKENMKMTATVTTAVEQNPNPAKM